MHSTVKLKVGKKAVMVAQLLLVLPHSISKQVFSILFTASNLHRLTEAQSDTIKKTFVKIITDSVTLQHISIPFPQSSHPVLMPAILLYNCVPFSSHHIQSVGLSEACHSINAWHKINKSHTAQLNRGKII